MTVNVEFWTMCSVLQSQYGSLQPFLKLCSECCRQKISENKLLECKISNRVRPQVVIWQGTMNSCIKLIIIKFRSLMPAENNDHTIRRVQTVEHVFFIEYAGELRIIALRRRNV